MRPRADQPHAGAPDTCRFVLGQSDVLPTMRPRHLDRFQKSVCSFKRRRFTWWGPAEGPEIDIVVLRALAGRRRRWRLW